MPNSIHLIVEGDGEVSAAPELIRRLLHEHFQRYEFLVTKTYNAHSNDNLVKPGGLEKFLGYARFAWKNAECDGLLLLIDVEADNPQCPVDFAKGLAQRAVALNLPFPVAVVCANCEYEAWFLASLETIRPGFLIESAVYEGNPEGKCNAKEWLSKRMQDGRIYKETQDQVRMTNVLDFAATRENSRSFQRLVHAVEELLSSIEAKAGGVTTPQMR